MQRLLTAMMATCASAVVAGGAHAEMCRQEHATYTDATHSYLLAFEPVVSDAAVATHRFTVTLPQTSLKLDGFVMGSEPVRRSYGTVLNHCPDGDVTGEDLAKCTVWEGLIYAQDSGKIDLLPLGDADAAAEILLTGFGPALEQSSAWSQISAKITPWDVFTLKGCAS